MNKVLDSIWQTLAIAKEQAETNVDWDFGVLEDKIQAVMDYISFKMMED